MAFGTVSFEELLGHCNEVFKNNQRCITDLDKRMQSSGYVTEVELEDEEILDDSKFTNSVSGFQRPFFEIGSVSVVQLSKKRPEDSCNGKISETTLPGYPKFVLYASVARNAAKAIAYASRGLR
ncbi:uncharacterized protein LOC141843494 [Curcuma longa]|uniref:uncharacterized protein LOC141843494 n=1 Tax=Curcuma longa TaxID=136217 RepID=UPI003D9F0588